MDNSFSDIALTLNPDLDPDINMFNTITRSPSKYFSEGQFNNFVNSSTLHTNLKIAHLNIRSYGKNQSNFWTIMENLKSKFHIAVFTETWSTLDTEELIMRTYQGYKTYAKSRANGSLLEEGLPY